MFLIFTVIMLTGCVNCILIDNQRSAGNELKNNSKCAILIDNQIKIDNELKNKITNVLENNGSSCGMIVKFNTTENISINDSNNSDNILFGITEVLKNLNNNGSILLITREDIVDGELFYTTVREIWTKHIKLSVLWKPKIDDEPNVNLKKIVFATEGYFINIYDNQTTTTYENILQNESVLGHYRYTFDVAETTRYIFIRILGSIENIYDAEIIRSSEEKLKLLEQNGAISFENVYFTALQARKSGPWTINIDAKKRVFITIVNENTYQLHNEVRFSKLVTSERVINILPAISIDVGTGSQLLATPSKYVNVYFEVTNNDDQPLRAVFTCTDTKSWLQHKDPPTATIAQNQTVTVTVLIQTPLTSGTVDTITFSIDGKPNAQKVAYLFVNNEKPVDAESPSLWYSLTTDCTNIVAEACDTGIWGVDIFARDNETGLMQLMTEPKGIYYTPNNFISGIKEEVTGHYVASCCKPILQITAVDLNGNQKNLTVDAYATTALSAGAISGIVIGVIVLIAVVVVIIYFIIKQRQKASLDLPTYKGPSSSRTAL